MAKLNRILLVSLVALPGVAMLALAAQAGETGPAYSQHVVGKLRAGNEQKDYIEELPRLIERYDSDGDGLDRADLERERQRQLARHRASKANEMLKMDLNADNKVTREEATAFWSSARKPATNIEQKINRLMADDTDHDGELTLEETLASVQTATACLPYLGIPSDILAADPNDDGRVTQEELKDMGRAIFAAFDDNKDGVISTSEYSVHRNQFRKKRPVNFTGLPGQCLNR